ncbi:MAG: L7Ae/L30e/S12e/Gadd45 family ribosomal protein [Culicoidibacterales bacterium]
MSKQILQTLGLAYVAKRAVSGEDTIALAAKKGQITLLFLAHDASDNTKKQYINKSQFYNFEVNEKFSKDELKHAIGKRACSALALIDAGFTKSIQKKLRNEVL